ncbi:unnamed protein product [Darwinula stevensoni]|uniref:Peptidase S1 domain-containing protein n=1 Tax=Darwinula stevensoni TaxID=69355 RepID=A0A7R9A961_9CRUS|nr:unnamed protein product [Darwinula stevensoni]CAG0897095.1 unnamed protein product [Darwinula stevensoni]
MLTSAACGTWSPTRDETTNIGESRQVSQSWLERLWNGFLGILSGNTRQDGPLIIGGSPASITQAPFMAYLYATFPKQGLSKPTKECSASILSEQWILTAAHCIYDDASNIATQITARVGSADRTSAASIKADRWLAYPSYNKSDPTKNYDVALIHLPKRLTFSSTVRPICYPQSDNVLGTSISWCDKKAYGWGYLQATDQYGSTILQKLIVQVTPTTTDCTTYTDERIICVKGDPPSSGVCHGDSGGPLVVLYGIAYVTGIASYVQDESCVTGAAGYTRASTYASWVKSTIGA